MNISFGTDGIRGLFSQENFCITKLHALGNALSIWLQEQNVQPKIIIITDTRASCDYIKSGLLSGLLLHKVHVFDAGILPTPAAYVLMHEYDAQLTIIFSASHNTATDNGIKFIKRTGKLSGAEEQAILELCKKNNQSSYNSCGKVEHVASQAEQLYCTTLITQFKHLNLAHKRMVLDLAHGALSFVAPKIFAALGADSITINNTPDGNNINAQCGSTYPTTLSAAILEHDADIGFAFDGDGDRIICVDAAGNMYDGDALLALLLENDRYQQTKTVVGTIMSNSGLEEYLLQKNISFIRTAVGDKQVKDALLKTKARLGGEQSGHIMLSDFEYNGDALTVALVLLETLEQKQRSLAQPFPRFAQAQTHIKITQRHCLDSEPLKSVIENIRNSIRGRVLVRYSGTEPILRIMVETEQNEKAQEYAQLLSLQLQKLLM